MARDLTLQNFLKELGLRIGAAVAVVSVFFGLGYLNRTDLLGLSHHVGTQRAFFTVAFLLIGLLTVGWVMIQRYRH